MADNIDINNQIANEAYKMSSVNGWAKDQLNILADMADERGLEWFANEARKIGNELIQLPL